MRIWAQVPMPVIAAIHGVAFGAALQLALGLDIRVVAPEAELSVMEIRWGLIHDIGGTQQLPGLVGRDVANDPTFTGRRVSGKDAVAAGLATRLAEDRLAAATELAEQIAEHDPNALRHAKSLLEMADRISLDIGFDSEQDAIAERLTNPTNASAVQTRLDNTRHPTAKTTT
jgi:enoyl-CoA hydratase/carnithine racemase